MSYGNIAGALPDEYGGLAYAGLAYDGLAFDGYGDADYLGFGEIPTITPITGTSSSVEITRLQAALKKKGYYQGLLSGRWDDMLERGVMNFQAGNGVTASGYADALTQAKLGLLDAATTKKLLRDPNAFKNAIANFATGIVSGLSTTGGSGVPGAEQLMTNQQSLREQTERDAVRFRNQALVAGGIALALVAAGVAYYSRKP
jgi:peptidoglycan hydrolase-like protein with peptidoglycan-binding domain